MKEKDRLQEIWEDFQVQFSRKFLEADSSIHIHPPLEIREVMTDMFCMALPDNPSNNEHEAREELIDSVMDTLNQAMQFAIFMEQQGIKYSDLSQCSCFNATDKELAELVIE